MSDHGPYSDFILDQGSSKPLVLVLAKKKKSPDA
jgi:hypothetical protein